MAGKGKLKKTIGSMAKVGFSHGLGLVMALGVSSLLAGRLGTSGAADAFFFARRLAVGFSEAANRISKVMLVPGLVAELETRDIGRIRRVWRAYQRRALLWLLPLAALVALAAPLIVRVAGPGLSGDSAALATVLLRILIFIIPVTVFRAISGSMLNAGRIFGVPELVAQLSRFLVVLSLIFMVPPFGVRFLAWVMLCGSALAALTLTLITERSLKRIQPKPKPEPQGDRSGPGRLLLPGLLVFGSNQLLIWVEYGFASTVGTGGIASLEYGYRLMEILPGVIAASLTTVMYTEFSRQMARGERQEMYRSIARSLRSGLFVLLPVVSFLAFQADSVTGLLLHHGKFDAEAAHLTARIMRMVALAGVGTFMARVLLFGVYADSSVKVMRLVGTALTAKIIARLACLILLIGPMGVAGVALGRSLSILIRLAVVFFLAYRAWGRFLRAEDVRNMALVVVITLVAMGAGFVLDGRFGWSTGGSVQENLVGLAAVAAVDFGIFLGLSALARLPELKAAVSLVRRRRGAAA